MGLERGHFRIVLLVVERLGRESNPVGEISEFPLSKKFERSRLINSHCGLRPLRVV